MAAYPIPHSPEGPIFAPHRTEILVRRSRFITSSGHAPSTEAARAFVDAVRQNFPDATHNCWAFAAGAPGQSAQVGFSDDGEPHGTAGRPMLTLLLHSGMGEIVSVVTRYFGGVKLGTGGLVRAYQTAVRENLESLPQRQKMVPARAEIVLDYSHVDRLRRLLPTCAGRIEHEEFGAQVRVHILLPAENLPAFVRQWTDQTQGSAPLRVLEPDPA